MSFTPFRMPVTREQVISILHEDKVPEWAFDKTIEDVLLIVNQGKTYPPRGRTQELRIPQDFSTSIARKYFGVDAYTAGS
jgi:hypothetical protein